MEGKRIKVAIPKGRLLKDVVKLFSSIGIDITDTEHSRRLVFHYPKYDISLFLVKPFDVVTYVKEGVADIGIAGDDVIEEIGGNIYEPLDLGFGKCRLVVAQREDFVMEKDILMLKVATKYPRITEKHYSKKGIPLDIIKLYGSVELAATCGLAHQIVDLVETGRTLKENRLIEVEKIMDVSAKLIVNRSSYNVKYSPINDLISKISSVLED
ncbi:MAG: ATP phosphoribosyltransferase [Thermosulfidibacteraceae bacterium]|jgi:ATP phosphoribosyltransferase